MKRYIPFALLILVLLAFGELFIAYDRSESFGPDDEPIRAIEP